MEPWPRALRFEHRLLRNFRNRPSRMWISLLNAPKSHMNITNSIFNYDSTMRSSSSDDLLVNVVRLLTIGRRAFLVAGARTLNDLPVDVTSAPSLLIFRKRLRLHLLRLSYPDLVFTARCTLVQSAVLRSHVVCPSVTFVDCDRIGWNSSEIISPLVILGCSLSADSNIRGLFQG